MKELGNLLLLDDSARSIVLQTRLGRSVKNFIDPPPRADQVWKYRRLRDKHPLWEERVPATGGYNCVGLVWASRRTGIFDEDQIQLVFGDDGFRLVDISSERLFPGDLVAYWTSSPPRHFIHVGLIMEFRSIAGLPGQSVPWVLSKMDATSGEVAHGLRDVDFGLEFVVEYWTERPRHKQE